MDLSLKLRKLAAFHLARPYIRRELPGWGRLYNNLVGSHQRDADWREEKIRWISGKLHGYQMQLDISGWSNRKTFFLGRFYDLPTQLVLQSVLGEGDLFVDIGANEGMMTLLASRIVGPRGKVIAFEPNPKPRACLEAAIERNDIANIEVRPIGLGASDALLTLSVPKFNSGEGSFGKPAYNEDDLIQIDCPVKTADAELDGLAPTLIKIDVEGFEPYVIEGLKKVMAKVHPPVVMEVVSGHLRNAGGSVDALVATMQEAGYRGFQLGTERQGMKHGLALHPVTPSEGFRGDVLWVHQDDRFAFLPR
ncbi:MAG TPA: FkbM family methyltransferase [Sphingomonas sp.]|nr:FkbM family methyltransferase [Sphingomonas sp.]